MLSKILYNNLKKVYPAQRAMQVTMLIFALSCVAAFLTSYPSIRQFIKGNALSLSHIVFFVVFIYGLVELYLCVKIQGEEENSNKPIFELQKKATGSISSESGRTFKGLKDTFIFHQKMNYNAKQRLQSYDIPVSILNEVIEEQPGVDVQGLIGGEEEEDHLAMMDLSEEELKELFERQERAQNSANVEIESKQTEHSEKPQSRADIKFGMRDALKDVL